MIAIIILNYKTYKETKECVYSIIDNTKECEYKIFVVDNHSEDGSYKKLLLEFENNKKVKVVSTKRNNGYSAGNNYVCKKLDINKYDKICIINSDVHINNNAIKLMSDAICDDVAVAGPSVVDINGKETQLLRKAYNFTKYLYSKKPLYYLRKLSNIFSTEYEINENTQSMKFVGMVSGCCFMIDAEIFRQVNFFDENIFLYCEEWILAKKLEKKDKATIFLPEAKVTHYHAKSTSKRGEGFQSFHMYISAFYYLKYYTDTKFIGLIYAYLQNIFVFAIRSLYNKSYKGLLRRFIFYSNKILCTKEKNKVCIRK